MKLRNFGRSVALSQRMMTHEGEEAVTSRSVLGDRISQLPAHGAGKELGKGLVEKIKKDLNLK